MFQYEEDDHCNGAVVIFFIIGGAVPRKECFEIKGFFDHV